MNTQNKVSGQHDYDPRLLKSALVIHVRQPHVHGTRVEYVAESAQNVRKWGIEELRHAHAELHGGSGIP